MKTKVKFNMAYIQKEIHRFSIFGLVWKLVAFLVLALSIVFLENKPVSLGLFSLLFICLRMDGFYYACEKSVRGATLVYEEGEFGFMRYPVTSHKDTISGMFTPFLFTYYFFLFLMYIVIFLPHYW